MIRMFRRANAIRLGGLMALLLVVSVSAVSAETLMMPNRPALRNASEVVWGITTQANGTAYTMDFGDGVVVNGNVADRSYINFNHTYALAGTFTATLTVGVESATTQIAVYDAAVLSAFDLRGVNINRAIENGLRYLWVNQSIAPPSTPSTRPMGQLSGFDHRPVGAGLRKSRLPAAEQQQRADRPVSEVHCPARPELSRDRDGADRPDGADQRRSLRRHRTRPRTLHRPQQRRGRRPGVQHRRDAAALRRQHGAEPHHGRVRARACLRPDLQLDRPAPDGHRLVGAD